MNKVSIIGTGSVGSTIAYTLTVMGLASEIVMIDINNEKALGEALDIRQGTPFCGACSIYAGDYRDAVNSDIVIVTSGIARKGATFYAVSVSVCHICKCLLGGIDTTMTVSTMMHGEYGIENVALSTLNMVGHEGVRGKVNVPMTDEEVMLLRKSADTLKDVISNLEI